MLTKEVRLAFILCNFIKKKHVYTDIFKIILQR